MWAINWEYVNGAESKVGGEIDRDIRTLKTGANGVSIDETV